jgi:acetolactate decarboxylase
MRRCGFLILFFIAAGLCGCCGPARNTITQFSTLDALLAGAYDGQVSCRELLQRGDLGIGTFESLDGEMVLLDAKVYQVKADGKVYLPPACLRSPFAAVVKFDPDSSMRIKESTDLAALEKMINDKIDNKNIFCAIKIKGSFARMKTRSVPCQRKPYPPLADVTKAQPVFDLQEVSGTIVGFRLPEYIKGINMPGYHFHFISDDAVSGGHVLDLEIKNADVLIDTCDKFFLVVPSGKSLFSQVDLSLDRSKDMEKAERSK